MKKEKIAQLGAENFLPEFCATATDLTPKNRGAVRWKNIAPQETSPRVLARFPVSETR